MATLHNLEAYSVGNLTGQQSAQRDFSPYVVHFTSWGAMAPLRTAIVKQRSAKDIASLFQEADARSFEIIKLIVGSHKLLARSPSEHDQLPPCVCFSECNLPGLLSHSERYGRFGIAVRKSELYQAGGRPCLYLGEAEYAAIAKLGRGRSVDEPEGRLFGLSNVYVPPRSTNKVQDYTHEREWRVFRDVDLRQVKPAALFAPSPYTGELTGSIGDAPVVPLDMLFQWGA
jgi:Putative abortive phage resistance protein AbiGi, antitoxin